MEDSTHSPLTDTTGALCAVDQLGPVWFLVGPPGGTAIRKCSIPAGKFIFSPIITAEWSAAEAVQFGNNCPIPANPNGKTEAALRACAVALMNRVTVVEADVDGVVLKDLMTMYRVQSPLFSFTPVADNPVGIPPGITNAVSDGFWILLRPLCAGTHTVHFHGNAPSLGFETEATYNLTVVPKKDETQDGSSEDCAH